VRRALCVGIDEYSFSPLRGCVSDAERMVALLGKHEDGAPNFDCLPLVAPRGGPQDAVTRAKLRQSIETLFRDRADIALLHFSGHGTNRALGGYLVTQDARGYDEGVAMSEVLALANASQADEVVVFLDCCYSGQLGAVSALNQGTAILREGVSILTASRGDQQSVETGGGGLFTSLVIDALEGGVADLVGEVTAPGVYAAVEAALGAWEQRPLFKSHVSKLISLRKCKPPIDPDVLRELPHLFPLPAEDLPLSPAFEGSSQTADVAKTALFRKLQDLARVHLVVPVDAQHMYDAAMQSKACRLTPSGRYYWRLAMAGRI
jgi:hypothetical protein